MGFKESVAEKKHTKKPPDFEKKDDIWPHDAPSLANTLHVWGKLEGAGISWVLTTPFDDDAAALHRVMIQGVMQELLLRWNQSETQLISKCMEMKFMFWVSTQNYTPAAKCS